MKNYNNITIWESWSKWISYMWTKLPPDKIRKVIEQVKFTYTPFGKTFKKQIKTIEEQGEKQIKVLEEHGEQIVKSGDKKESLTLLKQK